MYSIPVVVNGSAADCKYCKSGTRLTLHRILGFCRLCRQGCFVDRLATFKRSPVILGEDAVVVGKVLRVVKAEGVQALEEG